MPRTLKPDPTTEPRRTVPRAGPVEHAPGDLPLPHERDEAAGQVSATPDPKVAQAKRDLDAGQVDTDLRATPGLDATRRADLVRRASR